MCGIHVSNLVAQRPVGLLSFLDLTKRHVHRVSKSRHTRDWCVEPWSMVALFRTPKGILQDELEKVLKRAVRFVTGNYTYDTGSLTGILEQLK